MALAGSRLNADIMKHWVGMLGDRTVPRQPEGFLRAFRRGMRGAMAGMRLTTRQCKEREEKRGFRFVSFVSGRSGKELRASITSVYSN